MGKEEIWRQRFCSKHTAEIEALMKEREMTYEELERENDDLVANLLFDVVDCRDCQAFIAREDGMTLEEYDGHIEVSKENTVRFAVEGFQILQEIKSSDPEVRASAFDFIGCTEEEFLRKDELEQLQLLKLATRRRQFPA